LSKRDYKYESEQIDVTNIKYEVSRFIYWILFFKFYS